MKLIRTTNLALVIFCVSINLQQSFAQLIPFRVNQQYGYINPKNELVIPAKFDYTDFFQGEMAFVLKDSNYYGINSKGEIITPALKHYGVFNYGLCPVLLKDGTCVYINSKGETAIDKGFDAAENFSEGLAVVSVTKKLGIIDTLGNWIRLPDFDTSSAYFKSGFLMAISKGKYFYINRKGQTLQLPDTVMPAGVFSEGLAPVYVVKPFNSDGQKIKTYYLEFIDSSGKVALNNFYHDGFNYSEYIAFEKEFINGKAIIKTKNDLGWDYYFLDKKGRFSPLYSFTKHLGDSLFLCAIGYYMADIRIVDSNYYVMGQFQQKPTQVGEMGNGLLAFRNKEGFWGYVNSNCQELIKCKYSAAFPFKNGYAIVIYNGYQGVIDTNGKEFWVDR